MASYPTSYPRTPDRGRPYRFVVTYEDPFDANRNATFAVMAGRISEATALVINYIDQNNLHTWDYEYYLIAVKSDEDTDYIIN